MFTILTMHLFHITQCTIQNRNAHIFAPNGTLWDKEQVHCGICDINLFFKYIFPSSSHRQVWHHQYVFDTNKRLSSPIDSHDIWDYIYFIY